MEILERVVAIATAFDQTEVPHSFGGALALGFYGTARFTHDIDINVYLDVEDADRALAALYSLGVRPLTEAQHAAMLRDGQATKLRWDRTPIDLFFANLEFHQRCAERRRIFALLGHDIAVLSPEDLIVCKVAFGRAKDALDVREMLRAMGAGLDVSYMRRWVEAIVGSEAPSSIDLEQALAERIGAARR